MDATPRVERTPTSVEHRLRDGSVVTLRHAAPADGEPLHAMYGGLGREDVRLRFFSPTANVDEMLDRLLEPRNVNLVALAGSRLLGHGMYAPITPREAEVAFTVAPEAQGRGIATLLLRELAATARDAGVETFVADVLPDNYRMVDVFRSSGFPASIHSRAGTVEVELPTAASPEALERYAQRERLAAIAGVGYLLRPDGVVVVGASRRRGTIAGELVHNLLAGGYPGPLHLVGADEALRTVADVPGTVELGVLAVPAEEVLAAARACAERGARALVVLGAGFAETGPAGAARQSALLEVCRAAGMRLVGPNCMGIRNNDPAVRLDATFAPLAPRDGRLGLLTQSGGLGIAAMEEARRRGIGLSAFLSVGNKADVSGNDLLDWWEQDEGTGAILLYLESFGNPRRFARIARRVARTTPIVAVASGRSAAGARAAVSHTGRLLAASDATVDALFHHSGVIRVDTLEELLDTGALLADLPAPRGPRVGIVGNAGGLGVLALDACAARGSSRRESSRRGCATRSSCPRTPAPTTTRRSCRPWPRAVRSTRSSPSTCEPWRTPGRTCRRCCAAWRRRRRAASRSSRCSSARPGRARPGSRSTPPSRRRGRWRTHGATTPGASRRRIPWSRPPACATARRPRSSPGRSARAAAGSAPRTSRPCSGATACRSSGRSSPARRPPRHGPRLAWACRWR